MFRSVARSVGSFDSSSTKVVLRYM